MVISNTVACNLLYVLEVSLESKTHTGLPEVWPVLCPIVPSYAGGGNSVSFTISEIRWLYIVYIAIT